MKVGLIIFLCCSSEISFRKRNRTPNLTKCKGGSVLLWNLTLIKFLKNTIKQRFFVNKEKSADKTVKCTVQIIWALGRYCMSGFSDANPAGRWWNGVNGGGGGQRAFIIKVCSSFIVMKGRVTA